MYDLCTIGHITKDKVVTGQSVNYMPGGTAFYFSKALEKFDIGYVLLTAVAAEDMHVVEKLVTDGITVRAMESRHSVYFENIYFDNPDHREQNVLSNADAFSSETMPDVKASIYHLGPLLAEDIPVDMIRMLAGKGMVSLDAQGYLRTVRNKKVIYGDWKDKTEALPCISMLKANELEMEILTGTQDPHEGAKYLAGLGVKEVIITLGSKGSMVLADDVFYEIPAYQPVEAIDATGCGDTYMAGYLYQKIKGANISYAASFGAAMATLKIERHGPFSGNIDLVKEVMKRTVMA